MKNKILATLLALALPIAAQLAAPTGIPVQVQLTSGTSQTAQFLGIQQDTVLLGGFINGKFTTVRLHRSLFKTIQDSSGKILNLDSMSVSQDTSSIKTPEPEEETTKTDWKGKTLLFPIEHRAIDSALATRLSDITFQIFLDQGKNPQQLDHEDFFGCNTRECFFTKAKKNGAEAIFSAVISPAKQQDSIQVEMRSFFLNTNKTYTATLTLSARNATREILTENRWVNFLEKAAGKTTPPRIPKSFIFVETDPEGASLAKVNGGVICRTPCTFATRDSGRISLEAYWRVDNHLWAAQTVLFPIPGDTAKANLKLKRVQPEIEVISTPAGAEIFTEETINVKSKSIGTTPKVYSSLEPGPAALHLWKSGYQDTIVSFHVNALGKVVIDATLKPLIDPQEIATQKALVDARNHRALGFTLIGSALAPLIAGGILTYLAQEDYNRARDIREELELPSSSQGPNYQAKVSKNKHYADRGDAELYTGIGLFGLAAAMAGIGWVFTF
jgi:hypothetical protein